MVARKRKQRMPRIVGGWAWFHSKREPQREAERQRVRQERAEKAEAERKERLSTQAKEIERNKQRANVYKSRAEILEAKTRARMAGRTSRSTFFGGHPKSSGGRSSLTRRRKVGKTSVSFW